MIRTVEDLDRVREECRAMVTKRSMVSAGAAAVPIPGADLLVDAGLLTKLLPDISERFGLDHKQVEAMEPQTGNALLVLATSMGNGVIGRRVTKTVVVALLRRVGVRMAAKSFTKYIPLIGSIAAATISFGAMKLVGNRHVDDCYAVALRMIGGEPKLPD